MNLEIIIPFFKLALRLRNIHLVISWLATFQYGDGIFFRRMLLRFYSHRFNVGAPIHGTSSNHSYRLTTCNINRNAFSSS